MTSVNVRFEIVPSASGERLGTSAVNCCVALRPPGSVAVTVMVAVPCETALMVSVAPDMLAVTRLVFDDETEYSRSSSGSGSENEDATLKLADGDVTSVNVRFEIVPTATGELLVGCGTTVELFTVTSKRCSALRLPGSVAVTVMVAVPCEAALMVSVPPSMLVVTTPVSSDSAE